jgi:hypothetical protein
LDAVVPTSHDLQSQLFPESQFTVHLSPLTSRQARTLALALHELTTNAAESLCGSGYKRGYCVEAVKDPPIATALIGAGALGLWRTQPIDVPNQLM